ncbi:hypothetical protein FB451DRAFT_1400411 [Mycena latifolia]|nr:hypothetical protein FB451DRAFT_1400411 [Mycena latifolia]
MQRILQVFISLSLAFAAARAVFVTETLRPTTITVEVRSGDLQTTTSPPTTTLSGLSRCNVPQWVSELSVRVGKDVWDH